MSLLVVGTIAFDGIETPHGAVLDETGGSATYFSLAASRFTRVRLVGAVGPDFGRERLDVFRGRDVDLAGLEVVSGGRTFRWSGRYQGDMNAAETLETQLNVLATFDPKLPGEYPTTPFVFLANADPRVQLSVLDRTEPARAAGKRFVMADTMNLWIEHARDGLLEVLRRVDAVILNDGEARMLTGERNLIRAGSKVLELGPKAVIVKKGEHGAFLFSTYVFHAIPAYPVTEVIDPTGAGDSFAGGLMGHLARTGRVSVGNLKRGMVYGTIAASFTVAGFGTRALAAATREDFDLRLQEFESFVA
jgi:sugar/nucleoside kinase (ribokinase family)